jgi:hypothetical protein
MNIVITPDLVKNKNLKYEKDTWAFLPENSGSVAIVNLAKALIQYDTVYIGLCTIEPNKALICQKVLTLGRSPWGDVRVCGEEDNPSGAGSYLLFRFDEGKDQQNISMEEFAEFCVTLAMAFGNNFCWLDSEEYKLQKED